MKTIEQIRAAFNGSLLNIPVTLPIQAKSTGNIPQCYWSNPIPGWDAPQKGVEAAPQLRVAQVGGKAAPGLVYSVTSVTTLPDCLQYVPDYAKFAKIKADVIDQIPLGELPDDLQKDFKSQKTTDGDFLINPVERRVSRLRRTVRNSANKQTEEVEALGVKFKAHFLTMTYREGVEWSPRHITDCIKAMRAYFGRGSKGKRDKNGKIVGAFAPCTFRYVWVAEIQEKRSSRTAEHGVHYHMIVWLPADVKIPFLDVALRGDGHHPWWPHGSTRYGARKGKKKQGGKMKNPVAYLMKYVSKCSKYPYPKGCRTHGAGGLSKDSRLQVAWWNIPGYVREKLGDYTNLITRMTAPFKGVKGVGGWLSKLTGEWIPSEFYAVSFNPLIIRRKEC